MQTHLTDICVRRIHTRIQSDPRMNPTDAYESIGLMSSALSSEDQHRTAPQCHKTIVCEIIRPLSLPPLPVDYWNTPVVQQLPAPRGRGSEIVAQNVHVVRRYNM